MTRGDNAPDSAWNASARAGESEAERVDRNYDDLLQELRVAQNGIQILFAFLLTVPFSNGFKTVTDFQRAVYFTALVLAALSAAMLIAPAVMHRIVFRQHMKAQLLQTAGRLALGGQVVLTFAVFNAVWLIGDYLYGHAVGILVAIGTLLWWVSWFFVVPLSMRHRHRDEETTSST